MAIQDEILKIQLTQGVFDNEEQKVSGIAQLAVNRGFDTLSPAQQAVVQPFLTQPCDGVRDPGGHYNDCDVLLTGEALKDAYQMSDFGSLLCEGCRDEKGGYEEHWARFSKD